ncbi:KAT8 regulatory NSL complex subunit 3, partial [Stegodyphus mimosarum]
MSFENKCASVEQYLRKLSGQEKEILLVDHNYVKAWNAHPDSHRTKPARMLFMKGLQRYPNFSDTSNLDEDIDIEGFEKPASSPFESTKNKNLANESEKSLRNNPVFAKNDKEETEDLDLSSCNEKQIKLYNRVMEVLNADRLAKLVCTGYSNEPVKKRLATENSAGALRQIFGEMRWDMNLLSWLHKTLLDKADIPTLSSYVDVLQTLRTKVPSLVDKFLQLNSGLPASDAISQMIKKQWDPVLPLLNQHKPKKLPGNPVILLCPSEPPIQQHITAHLSPRLKFWHNNLSSLCKIMNVPLYSFDKENMTIEDCIDQIVTSVRNKVAEIKNQYPNRPVILLGWTVGALIACHVALLESVTAVICLGFPLTGVNGSRGDLDDPLLDSKVPTLFVVGQNATMCSIDDVEDFRSRMRAETGLVVVGGCDDYLNMSLTKMKFEGATQAMVDRCILDEISDFLLCVFAKLSSHSVPNSVVSTKTSAIKDEEPELVQAEEEGKRKRRKPREYSPELSPVRKRQRHQISRQIPTTIPKVRLSPSSSETSSSGSSLNYKANMPKTVKKISVKRIGRPASGTWRKRLATAKSRSSLSNKEIASTKMCSMGTERSDSVVPTKMPSSDIKSSVPFPVHILPKKNDPVDVEKAFGRDSSFLPRPLTPTEPEDTVSAEETENALAELEARESAPVTETQPMPSSAADHLNQNVVSSERSFLPISDPLNENTVLSPAQISSAFVKPNTASVVESKSVSVSSASTLRTTFSPQDKVLSPASVQNLKSMTGVSLIANQLPTMNPTKSTIITLPSANSATILVSSPVSRSQPTKMIQLITKSSKTQTIPSSNSCNTTGESSDQQVCNLSLLSDVAGMTEPLKDTGRKLEASMSSATLVKLAVPDKIEPQPVKCLKVIKTVQAPSPPTRIETPEELVEKQLAIQALNNSINIESSSPTVKESGYSICYAKADGSIVSHAVTRPGYPPYLSRPSLIPAQSRGRGRARPAFPSKIFRFYDK